MTVADTEHRECERRRRTLYASGIWNLNKLREPLARDLDTADSCPGQASARRLSRRKSRTSALLGVGCLDVGEDVMDASGSKLELSRRTWLTAGAATVGALGLGVASAAPASADQQSGWRWCNRCQCLFYGDNYTTGWCTEGGGHNYQGSGNYTPGYGRREPGQPDWCWCNRCQSMWWGGSSSDGACPADGRRGRGRGHSKDGSGNYHIEYGRNPGGRKQQGWRWCRQCYCLCYSGNGSGSCPGGRRGHDFSGSGNYWMPHR